MERLRAELEVAREQQAATSEILHLISRMGPGSQAEPVLEAIVATAARLCGAEFALAHLLKEDGRYHTVASNKADAGLVKYAVEHPMVPSRGSLTGRTAFEGRTIHVEDCLADPEYAFPEFQRIGGFRSILGVPLIRDGVAIGVLGLLKSVVAPFTEAQIGLVTTFADQAVIALQNVRLFEELQESLRYQTATSDVLNVISRSPAQIEPVLDAIVETAGRLCEAYDTLIILREGEWLTAAAHAGPIEVGFDKKPVGRSWVAGRAVADREPVHVPDFLSALDEFPDSQPMNIPGGVRTILAVPLLRGGEAIGAITLRRMEVRPFSSKQVAVLQTFADQAVIAIENVRLFEEVQARTEELSDALNQQTATADVLKTISRSTFDLQTVLQTLVHSAARLCEADKATITRQKSGRFYFSESYGFPHEFMAYVGTTPVEPERGTGSGRALLEGKIVHIPDVQADPDYTWSEAQKLGDYRALLCIPMLREGVPIGVLSLTRSEPRPFTEKQIELVSTFADQAAIAIENVRLFESLEARTKELARSLEELRAAQDRLVQTEKLAALGQLTAGVAHEIKNPLNFVNNFAELSSELMDELKVALRAAPFDGEARADIDEIADTIGANLQKVVQHGRRADSIVKNMLLHSREGSGERRAIDLNASVEEALNLAYHSARAENPNFQVNLGSDFDPQVGSLQAFPQEFQRVLLNVISNGFYAVRKRQSGSADPSFQPELRLSTKAFPDRVEIRVRDNGIGISEDVKAKMFNPFFTTKAAGEGTGLGLSLSHDIVVKQHDGRIKAESVPGEFTEFTIVLPRQPSTDVALEVIE